MSSFSTPPPRADAFEDFKKEEGAEIYRILTENKGECRSSAPPPLQAPVFNVTCKYLRVGMVCRDTGAEEGVVRRNSDED